MFYLYVGYNARFWPVLIAPLLAGLLGDVLIWRLKPSVERAGALRLLVFVVPLAYFLIYFVMLLVTVNLWWTVHLWLGASFMAGVAGLGLSYLVAPPAIPISKKY
jgi:hypothetical protein